jgi:putative aminopeptidase FrvX
MKEKLNYELLKDLYCIHSKSGSEKRIRRFIKKWLKANVPEAVVTQDNIGNLYITKGVAVNYPCLCAHMDQVQDFHPSDFTCVETDEVIFGYSPKMRKQCGLGADDKNGIFLALSALMEYPVLKCAFFIGEEIGCIGSSAADIGFFIDCRFCAQIDRRGSSDMVTEISGPLCSDGFIKAADCESWGYRESDGMMTDVEALAEAGVSVSCINLSCGYYNPHTDCEFTHKPDLEKCWAFVCHLIEDCTAVYPFEYTNGWSRYNKNFNAEDSLLYEIKCVLAEEPNTTFRDFYDTVGCMYSEFSKESQHILFDFAKK